MYQKWAGISGAVLIGVASLLWLASPVLAQHGGGGHGGFGGGHGGFGGVHSGFGGHAGFGVGHEGFGAGRGSWNGWGHRGWYGGWYPGYYSGLYGYGYYPYTDYGSSYDSGTYSNYDDLGSPSYGYDKYAQPDYFGSVSQPDLGIQADLGSPVIYGSYGATATSSAPVSQNATAQVTVLVPPDAKIWFNNQLTKTTGGVRDFVSPPLDPVRNYSYDIRAEWNDGGRQVVQTRNVVINGGGQATVDFREPSGTQQKVTRGPSGS